MPNPKDYDADGIQRCIQNLALFEKNEKRKHMSAAALTRTPRKKKGTEQMTAETVTGMEWQWRTVPAVFDESGNQIKKRITTMFRQGHKVDELGRLHFGTCQDVDSFQYGEARYTLSHDNVVDQEMAKSYALRQLMHLTSIGKEQALGKTVIMITKRN